MGAFDPDVSADWFERRTIATSGASRLVAEEVLANRAGARYS
jgi:hypothetical protein